MLKAELKEKILAVVEAYQPVTAAKVSEVLKKSYNLDLSPEETNVYLSKMRTDFPKRTARSGDRYSVIDLED